MIKGQKLTWKQRQRYEDYWKSKKGKPSWNKGKKHTEEHKINLSKSHIGLPGSHKGFKHSEETKKIISQKSLGKLAGDKHPNWQGGKSFEPYSPKFNKGLKRLIKQRDNYTCSLCKEEGLCVHHINYDKKDFRPENLITLCRSCHAKTNFRREEWQKLFQRRK